MKPYTEINESDRGTSDVYKLITEVNRQIGDTNIINTNWFQNMNKIEHEMTFKSHTTKQKSI